MAVSRIVQPSGGFATERVAVVDTTSTWNHPEGASPTNPKKITVVSMGGGGSGSGSAGGGSGLVRRQELYITGSISIVIGSGGVSAVPGGSTTVAGIPVPGGAVGGSTIYNINAPGLSGAGGSQGGVLAHPGMPGQAPTSENPGSYGEGGNRNMSSIVPALSSDIVALASGGGGGGGNGAAFPNGRFTTGQAGGLGVYGNGGAGGNTNFTGRPAPQGGPFISGGNSGAPGNGYGSGGGGAGQGANGDGRPGVVIIYY